MFRCILCLSECDESTRSEEHVFPEAVGGTLTIMDLCKPCNDNLGATADAGLVDHVWIKLSRRNYSLPGKQGAVPNPFARGVLREGMTETTVRWEPGYVYRFPLKRTINGCEELILDPRDLPRAAQIREKMLSRRGTNRSISVTAAADAISGVVTFPLNLDVSPCERGLLKIAYELAFRLLGHGYLQEECARNIRRVLLDPSANIDESGISARFAGGVGLVPLPGEHGSELIGGVLPSAGRTFGYVRIFDKFDALVLVSHRDYTDMLGSDGAAFIIDVRQRGAEPVRTDFRRLGGFGRVEPLLGRPR